MVSREGDASLKIAFDLDDTLRPTYDYFNGWLKFGMQPLDLLEEDWLRQYAADNGSVDAESMRLTIDSLANALNSEMPKMRPIAGMVEAVGAIAVTHSLVVVTGVPVETAKISEEWVDKFFPGVFPKPHNYTNRFNPGGEFPTKAEVCEKLGIDILIDDYPRQNLPPETTQLIVGDYDGWTPEEKDLAPNEIRISSPHELVRYVEARHRERIQE